MIISHRDPFASVRHLNLRVRPFETEIIPRIGGGEGRIDDCANRVSREGLRDDVSERAGVVDDACGERQGIARVVGRELAPRRVRGVVGPEVGGVEPGTYRMVYNGDSKSLFGEITGFSGTSGNFTLV